MCVWGGGGRGVNGERLCNSQINSVIKFSSWRLISLILHKFYLSLYICNVIHNDALFVVVFFSKLNVAVLGNVVLIQLLLYYGNSGNNIIIL